MSVQLDVQVATTATLAPKRQQIQRWVEAALLPFRTAAEVCVRLVDRDESAALNQQYRGRSGPTNVLSFATELPEGVTLCMLGDLVICVPLVASEALDQDKPYFDHFAHLVVHGCLHLLGHDHEEESQAEEMESVERRILADLGIPDPYSPNPCQ
ncbi:MAG: rRNA maturation RNase YbeY [Pseudomonadota bacterium]|nr:rRNA maturation RNase YbeY [Pseudomonadota bacterium]